jgi:stage IV sporulation protein FB
MLIWLLAFFVSILVHELGHAMTVRYYGSHPSITLHGLGGLTAYRPPAYGSRGSGTLGRIFISFAGPLAGFLLAGAIVAAVYATGHALHRAGPFGLVLWTAEVIGSPRVTDFLQYVVWLSIVWGLFNLLPIFPLDGGHISREVLVKFNPRTGLRQSLVLSIVLAIVLGVLGLSRHDYFMAIIFGIFAYESYTALQFYGSSPW